MEELEELAGLVQVLQPLLAQIAQANARRQRVPDEAIDGGGQQHLAAAAASSRPRRLSTGER